MKQSTSCSGPVLALKLAMAACKTSEEVVQWLGMHLSLEWLLWLELPKVTFRSD